MAHSIATVSSHPRNFALSFARRSNIALFAVALFFAGALHAEDRASVKKVAPTYPPLARQMHIIGIIRVVATIGPNGAVVSAESTSGNKLLANAAIEAVKQWKFVPGPEQSTVTVNVEFQ